MYRYRIWTDRAAVEAGYDIFISCQADFAAIGVMRLDDQTVQIEAFPDQIGAFRHCTVICR
ncbi:hypothetical protein D3C78_1026280 [compost metagenome]